MNAFSRFADTGGLAGLFLGCSLLSFFEIFYFCIKECVKKRKVRVIKPALKKASNRDFIQSLHLQCVNEKLFIVREPLYTKHCTSQRELN